MIQSTHSPDTRASLLGSRRYSRRGRGFAHDCRVKSKLSRIGPKIENLMEHELRICEAFRQAETNQNLIKARELLLAALGASGSAFDENMVKPYCQCLKHILASKSVNKAMQRCIKLVSIACISCADLLTVTVAYLLRYTDRYAASVRTAAFKMLSGIVTELVELEEMDESVEEATNEIYNTAHACFRDISPVVREEAVFLFASFASNADVHTLCRLLRHDQADGVSKRVLSCLFWPSPESDDPEDIADSDKASKALVSTVFGAIGHPNPKVRAEAIDVMVRLKLYPASLQHDRPQVTPEAFTTFLHAALNDQEQRVQDKAREAIAAIIELTHQHANASTKNRNPDRAAVERWCQIVSPPDPAKLNESDPSWAVLAAFSTADQRAVTTLTSGAALGIRACTQGAKLHDRLVLVLIQISITLAQRKGLLDRRGWALDPDDDLDAETMLSYMEALLMRLDNPDEHKAAATTIKQLLLVSIDIAVTLWGMLPDPAVQHRVARVAGVMVRDGCRTDIRAVMRALGRLFPSPDGDSELWQLLNALLAHYAARATEFNTPDSTLEAAYVAWKVIRSFPVENSEATLYSARPILEQCQAMIAAHGRGGVEAFKLLCGLAVVDIDYRKKDIVRSIMEVAVNGREEKQQIVAYRALLDLVVKIGLDDFHSLIDEADHDIFDPQYKLTFRFWQSVVSPLALPGTNEGPKVDGNRQHFISAVTTLILSRAVPPDSRPLTDRSGLFARLANSLLLVHLSCGEHNPLGPVARQAVLALLRSTSFSETDRGVIKSVVLRQFLDVTINQAEHDTLQADHCCDVCASLGHIMMGIHKVSAFAAVPLLLIEKIALESADSFEFVWNAVQKMVTVALQKKMKEPVGQALIQSLQNLLQHITVKKMTAKAVDSLVAKIERSLVPVHSDATAAGLIASVGVMLEGGEIAVGWDSDDSDPDSDSGVESGAESGGEEVLGVGDGAGPDGEDRLSLAELSDY
ncbi:CONDENSIN COMPLEX SUBUNIT 3 [Carpediemonas membranifera]|uniref:CONDENSIN COMPLEX SUBUNIT 3 n=1 Tax=Carpediemonas membranifera TaxID=201153 RepID=A0A8J6AUS9_9EUKA|nr:CONDENSIN COMPLEX SUBUNIT 3 [Carpediemonas membranifera]|eukprot:KAG9393020.1 CONDENSIN COMPLEX SUBUNIT 3 [Carpediemonas membranifera]